jgi:hypothetical protein
MSHFQLIRDLLADYICVEEQELISGVARQIERTSREGYVDFRDRVRAEREASIAEARAAKAARIAARKERLAALGVTLKEDRVAHQQWWERFEAPAICGTDEVATRQSRWNEIVSEAKADFRAFVKANKISNENENALDKAWAGLIATLKTEFSRSEKAATAVRLEKKGVNVRTKAQAKKLDATKAKMLQVIEARRLRRGRVVYSTGFNTVPAVAPASTSASTSAKSSGKIFATSMFAVVNFFSQLAKGELKTYCISEEQAVVLSEFVEVKEKEVTVIKYEKFVAYKPARTKARTKTGGKEGRNCGDAIKEFVIQDTLVTETRKSVSITETKRKALNKVLRKAGLKVLKAQA